MKRTCRPSFLLLIGLALTWSLAGCGETPEQRSETFAAEGGEKGVGGEAGAEGEKGEGAEEGKGECQVTCSEECEVDINHPDFLKLCCEAVCESKEEGTEAKGEEGVGEEGKGEEGVGEEPKEEPKAEPPKEEPKVEPPKEEPPKEEPPKEEPPKEEPPKEEPPTEEPPKEEPPTEEPPVCELKCDPNCPVEETHEYYEKKCCQEVCK